ncbi:hypothetical protein KXV77_009841, partial [Aspergillus fumigatus]
MISIDKTYRSVPKGPTDNHFKPDEARAITHNPDWNHSLFDCCSPGSLCFTSCCLPCITFGRTQARVQDPTLQNYSSINSECAIFTVLALGYCQWIIQTIRR